jgi:hypothetical protein
MRRYVGIFIITTVALVTARHPSNAAPSDSCKEISVPVDRKDIQVRDRYVSDRVRAPTLAEKIKLNTSRLM